MISRNSRHKVTSKNLHSLEKVLRWIIVTGTYRFKPVIHADKGRRFCAKDIRFIWIFFGMLTCITSNLTAQTSSKLKLNWNVEEANWMILMASMSTSKTNNFFVIAFQAFIVRNIRTSESCLFLEIFEVYRLVQV